MNTFFYFQIAATIILISLGQVAFKYSSILLNRGYEALSINVISIVLLAFLLSGLGSIIWIIVLKNIDLNRAYPFMALSFIFVPILGFILFKEQLSTAYLFGSMLVIGGITIIAKYGY